MNLYYKQVQILVFCLITFISNIALSQNIKVTYAYGSKNKEIQELMDFENIYSEQLIFEGTPLEGKHYEINIQEFTHGEKTNTKLLFDSSEMEFFRNNSKELSLKFFFKISEGKLKSVVKGTHFSSAKVYNELKDNADWYVLKDFFGSEKEWFISGNLDRDIPILAIITPSMNADGTKSYCKVVQSEIIPEEFGLHFKIPHYFLITIKFKEK